MKMFLKGIYACRKLALLKDFCISPICSHPTQMYWPGVGLSHSPMMLGFQVSNCSVVMLIGMLLASESLEFVLHIKVIFNKSSRTLKTYQVEPSETFCRVQGAGKQNEPEMAQVSLLVMVFKSPVVTPYLVERISQRDESWRASTNWGSVARARFSAARLTVRPVHVAEAPTVAASVEGKTKVFEGTTS